jgi:carbamoyl-phosphate synthase large subunit
MRALSDPSVEIHAADSDPYAPGLYLVPSERRHLLPHGRHPEYVAAALSLCVARGIDAVVPTAESELLPMARARSDLARAGVRLLCASETLLRTCHDRWELLQGCAFDVPVPKTGLWIDQLRWSDSFPCVVKPRYRSSGRAMVRIDDRARLMSQPRSTSALVQEYLPGEEVSVDLFVGANGTIHGAVPTRRLKVVSGHALTSQTVFDRSIIKVADAVVRTMRLRGAIHIEFRRDRFGTARLLDVTAGFVGDMALTAKAGVNIPQLALDELFGLSLPSDALQFQEIAMTCTYQNNVIPAIDITAMEQQRLSRRAM